MEQLNLKLTLNANGSIKASWSKITGATRYQAYMSPVGASYVLYNEKNLTTTSYTSEANLEANKQYQVTVIAYGKSSTITSDGKKILIPLGYYNNTPLSVPANVKATADAVSVTVSFDKVSRATGYDILFDDKVYSVTSTSKKITGLTPKTSHTYAVRAKNPRLKSEYSATKTIKTLAQLPAVPSNIKKTATGTTAKISWGKVSKATSYELRFNGNGYNLTTTSKKFTGLTPGKSYRFKIRSKNADGASAYTDVKTVKTAPKPPTTVTATSTINSVTINWSKVTAASGYTVEFNGTKYRCGNSIISKTFTGLTPKTAYTYRVCSESVDGSGTYSTKKTITTLPQLPVAPSNSTKASTENSVTISWSPVSGATGYDVLINGMVYSVAGTSCTITGLSPNTSYTYQIRSKNADGASAYGAAKTVKTTPLPPSAPDATPTKDSVAISWTTVTGATGYDVLFNGVKYTVSVAYIRIPNLTPGTTYTYSIRVNNGDGSSSYCPTRTVTTIPNPPAAPANVRATATENSITISWDAASTATSYAVYFEGSERLTSGTSLTIKGLSPGTKYSYKVRAKNAGGYGPYSAESVMQTIQVVPDVPKNVKLTAKTDYIIIEWSKVFDADSYDVRVGGKVYRLTGTALRVEDLVPNTEYSLQVRANNEAGSSEYTEAQTVWTLLETPTDVWAKTTMNSVIVSWYPVEGATNYDVQFDGVPYNVTKSETITQIGENEPVEVRLDTYDSMDGTNIAMLTNTDEEEIDKHMYKFFVGLETGSKHTYCVRANNAHSSSSYSKLKEVTTDYEWESRLPLGKKRRTYPDGRMAYTGIDPVNALTGAFLWSYTWLEDFGKDKLHFTTMYDSRREGNSKILGNKWTHSLNYMLTMDEKAAYFTTPSGDVITFDRNTTNDTFRVKNGRYSGYTMEKTVNGGYGVKTSDGTEYIFDSNCCLDQMSENGQVIYQFASNEAGQIVEIEGRHGRCLYLTYENGHIIQATDMKGSTVKFSYKGKQLTSVMNADGNEMSFTYDNRDNLLTISDFTGERYLTNTYDVLDRVTQQSVRGRGGCEASYDEENRVTTFKDEMKNVTKYYYDEAGNVTTVEMEGTKIQNSYNENGQLTKQVDALGNVTEMAYDECGRMNCVIHPDGTKEQAFYNDQNQPVRVINCDGTECLYEYDENNNLTAVQDERGNSCFYTYDSNNNLISYTDKNGNLWTYSYDGNGHLKQAKDPEGNIYHYSHDAVGRLTSYTSPEGKTTSYHYSEAGDLLRMEEHDGAICYEYDRNGNCTGIVNKMGDMQRREYDNIGKLSLATDFMGNEYLFSYDKKGNLTKETDPLGYSASYAYDAFGNCIEWIDKNRNITQYSFDAANQLTEVKDAQGAVTRYVYDTMGQVKTIINPLNHQTEYTYDNAGRLLSETDALGNSICYTYDEVGNLLTKTDQEGAVTAYSYDKENRLCSIQSDAGTVKFTYDKLGRVIAVEDANGHAETAEYDGDGNLTVASDKENYRTAYTYDQSGRMIKVIAPNGGETSYEYDSNGNCTKVTDAEGNSYTYVYNANNQVIHVTDPLGHDTFYEYDAVGQLISVTDAKGAKTTFEYDGNGNLYKEINPLGGEKTYRYDCHKRLREVTDEEGYLSSFLYDAAGNMTSYLDANKKRWTYTYDAANRLTAVTDRNGDCLTYTYTKTGKIAKVTDPEGAETSYQYDAMGRLVKMSDALEHSLSFTYDRMGRVLSQTDANGNITKYEYSPAGNLIGVTDAEGNTTAYTYNALGQMLTATDALGNITSYTYNALGQVASITDAMGAETTFTYTANGQIATVTDANGGITEYTYDACGNLIQTKDPLGNIVSYEYDAMNNRIKECLSASEEQTCITLYQYDKRGCMIREINPLSEEKTYTYDGNGNYVAFTDEDGSETKVTYDLNNRPIQMNYSDGRAATFRYNKRGELVEMKDWNGTVSMERDRLGRLTKVTDHNGYVTGYSYDAMGNKTEIFYPDGSGVNYAYDKNNRLAAVTDTERKTTKYGYDPVGNIVSVTRPGGIATYAYNANRRPVKASYQLNDGTSMEESFTYDVLGHLSGSVRKGSSADFARSTAYTYDALGRLATCQENQDTESYIYDALGNRIRRLLNGVEQSN
ncbi:MAG: fibronectin type III domain-containing protein, partial [Lachnospira sp.]|nr:fibronectin type III domain-containing protein [Lachnospira sp.]